MMKILASEKVETSMGTFRVAVHSNDKKIHRVDASKTSLTLTEENVILNVNIYQRAPIYKSKTKTYIDTRKLLKFANTYLKTSVVYTSQFDKCV